MGRAPCCEKVGLKRGRWTAEEDEILTKYILANGEGSWRSLPKNAGLLRCGKSCRLRWINYLRADLKRGNITKEEEETIVKLHTSLGNRWSLIAAHLPGRTDNEIKNYWNSHLSRRIYSFRRNAYDSSPTTTTATATAGTTTAPSPLLIKPKTSTTNYSRGRTSRAAMKKQRAALISLRNKGQQQPMSPPNQVMATQITEETDPVVNYNTPTSTQISGSGSGSGSRSTTSSDRNGTQDLELGNITVEDGSSCDKFNAAEDGGAVWCCRKSGDDAGQGNARLGPYEWLDSEIKRLKYCLQEAEGEGLLGSGINLIDSLEKESEVGGGNNCDGRGPIHGRGGGIMMQTTSEVGIESNWAFFGRSPSPGPGSGLRIGDEGLNFLFDWDWPAGGDVDHHSQWEWDMLWGEDDGIGSLSSLNYD